MWAVVERIVVAAEVLGRVLGLGELVSGGYWKGIAPWTPVPVGLVTVGERGRQVVVGRDSERKVLWVATRPERHRQSRRAG